MSISKQLLAALEAAEKKGETRYKIAQESRVAYSVLVRFLDGERSLKLATVDRLAEYLNLELKPTGRRK